LKKSIVALVAGAAMALTACGGETVAEETNPPVDQESPMDTSTGEDQISTTYQTSVNSIFLGMSEQEVVQQLHAEGRDYEIVRDDDTVTYMYYGVAIVLLQDSVWLIAVEHSEFTTDEGVRVGDSSATLDQVYGEDYRDNQTADAGGTWYTREYFDGQTYLTFTSNEEDSVGQWTISGTSSLP
jgi:hypothetical protein